jgi:hypothetical protein
MATDRNGSVVLFGGNGGASPSLGDTWLWNGSNWSQVLASGPLGRGGASVATARNGDVVLFGGISFAGGSPAFLADTWVWDGSGWVHANSTSNPPARYGATMATDKNGRVVLFGGQGPDGSFNDTWLWNGSDWAQASPSTSPPARVNAAMATDENGNVVLFGGAGSDYSNLGDTWLWDGSNWSQASPSTSPSGRSGPAMASDSEGNVVLFGGATSSGFTSDTWLWNGSDWTQASSSTSPPARVNAALATDENGKFVLFGGYANPGPLNDTWLLSLSADTTPPVITVPANMSAPATSPAGATVTFQVWATDAVDGPEPVTCAPPSGSTFAINAPGQSTDVICSASDGAGNTATATFSVHVKGAGEQLADLGNAVKGVGPGTSLADKVKNAQAALAKNNVRGTCSILAAFISQVRAQAGKSIPMPTPASGLIADATRIRTVLGC